MHRASLNRLVPALLLLAAAGCNNDTGTEIGTCEAGLMAGELVISEVMPDPKGADDSSFEWFEIYNPGDAEVTLTGVGLEYSKIDGTSAKGHLIKDTLTIPARGYLTVGKATAETRPDHIDYGYGADLGSMGNTTGKVRLVCGKVVLDEVLYQDLKDGYSRSLGPKPPDAIVNDDLGAWCNGSALYNANEYGSPRAANPDCPRPVPACGMCYDDGELRASRPPAPGQLVISEVMPNAKLTDNTVGEWFELSVVDGEFDLNCLQYGGNTTKFLADPSKPEMTLMEADCLTVRAGDIKLFAEQLSWPGTDFLIKFALVDNKTSTNPDPGVYVGFGGQILDEFHYPKAHDGIAWSLDPGLLDPIANDDINSWCLAVDPFAEGDLGTPGAPNPSCPVAAPAGSCIDGDSTRLINYAEPGDLIVTEIFPDPKLADTSLGEWFELFAVRSFDLNGLTFGKTLETPYAVVADPECRPIIAGNPILLAKTDDPLLNGGLPTPDWIGPKIALTNTNSTLVVGVDNKQTMSRVELDAISWAGTTKGKSQQLPIELIPAFGPIDATLNDDPTLWCAASQPFGAGDLGTPRAENLSCGALPPVGGQCTDPVTMMPRDIKPPAPGDLIITELHPDPDALLKSGGAGEPAGEWFELFAAAEFDLNGLVLGNTFPTKKHTVASAMCLPVVADSHLLLASAGKPTAPPNPVDPGGNGGLPTPDYAYSGLTLTNGGGGLYVGVGELLIDAITYPKAGVGKATQLSAASGCLTAAPLDPACNDDFAADWCLASSPYGLGDSGTPQAANLDCGGGGGDMDGMCFDSGLNQLRPIVVPAPGDLVINEFLADPTVVSDANGEWFEIAALASVDLNNLKILNKANPDLATLAGLKPLLVAAECLRAEAGSLVLFARQADPEVNGGLPPVDHVVTTTLTNGSGGLSIAVGDTLLHTVSYALAQKPGKSTLLDPGGLLDPMNTVADGPPWCFAADAGTPKAVNPNCP